MATDARQIIGTLRNSHNRLVGFIEPLGEAELLQRSYDTDWTIAQVLSHLGSGVEIGLPWIEGTSPWSWVNSPCVLIAGGGYPPPARLA
jgi:hypothetical protein